TGPNDVWAATSTGAAHWDGSGWTAHLSVDDAGNALAPFLFQIVARAPNDVWAGAPFKVLHYDGVQWKLVNDGTTGPEVFGPVHGIWPFSPTDVWFSSGAGV